CYQINILLIYIFFSMSRRPSKFTLFPSRRSSDLENSNVYLYSIIQLHHSNQRFPSQHLYLFRHHMNTKHLYRRCHVLPQQNHLRSEEHTSELQSRFDIVCRLLLEKKKKKHKKTKE